MAKTLKEIASLLPAGTLGLLATPNRFIFRPKVEFDPRVELLLEQNWSEIKWSKKDTCSNRVLTAYATVEAYTELYDSDLEHQNSNRFLSWLARTVSAQSPAILYPEYDDSKIPLFDYQKDGAVFLEHHDRAMLSLSPGLGKTLTSAYAAGRRHFQRVLVIAPFSLLYYWKNELKKWSTQLPRVPTTVIWHKKIGNPADFYDGYNEDDPFWAIMNPETAISFSEEIAEMDFDCLIVDESIMYKHRDSQRSSAIKTIADNIPVTWLLTGAPATRYLDDFWHQFHILNPQAYSSYWRFARKYCVVTQGQWGDQVVANKRGAEKEIQKNFADIYFARSQDDVADIPDWIFEDLDIEMGTEQSRIYDKLRKEFLIELEPLDDGAVIQAKNHLSLMIRSIQVASNPLLVGSKDVAAKWDALPELMEIYPGPYIIWINFIESGVIIRDRLSAKGMRTALANGATQSIDRQLIVDAFQDGQIDVLIMNNQVGKFGFTLTKARTAIFVERMYDDAYFQCLYRNRRIGTTQSPIVVNLRSRTASGKKTIDHVIHDVLDYRTGMIKNVTAGMLKEVLKDD